MAIRDIEKRRCYPQMMSAFMDTKTALICAATGKKVCELKWNACNVDGQLYI